MTNNCLLTILLPIYNGSKYVDRCFKSLIDQTYSDFKIICIDDGSTDSTPQKLKIWKGRFKYDQMKVFTNKKTQGVTASLNFGLDKISTVFTARLDCDDWWVPTKLSRQMQFLSKHPDYGIVGCNYINVSATYQKQIILPETDTIIKRRMVIKNPLAHSCVVFDTRLIKGLGGYDSHIRYGQDYDLWFRSMPHTRFYNIQDFLCFRALGSGISTRHQKPQMLQCLKTQIRYIKLYRLSPLNYFYLLEPLALVIKSSLW